MLSILCVRLMIKVKVGIPENFKVGWYPPKKLGRVTLNPRILTLQMGYSTKNIFRMIICFFHSLIFCVFGDFGEQGCRMQGVTK